LFLVAFVSSNTWVQLGDCGKWSYSTVDEWGDLTCTTPNVCQSGMFQSPVKISSEQTIVDGSLQSLVFQGYTSTNLTMSFDGTNIWIDYPDQGTFNNPGNDDGVMFTSRYIRITTHNEQLLFTGVNRLSLDVYHYQIKKTWQTFPFRTEALGVFQLLFKIGNESLFLKQIFNDMARFQRGLNRTQNITTSWDGLASELTKNQQNQADGYYNFQGSMTVPPCSETVEWHVFDYEWEISQDQFNVIRNLVGGNQRPVQRQLAKVRYFDPLIGDPVPFDFSKLSNGSIAAIILAIIVVIVAVITLIFGIISKNESDSSHYTSY